MDKIWIIKNTKSSQLVDIHFCSDNDRIIKFIRIEWRFFLESFIEIWLKSKLKPAIQNPDDNAMLIFDYDASLGISRNKYFPNNFFIRINHSNGLTKDEFEIDEKEICDAISSFSDVICDYDQPININLHLGK